MLFVYLMALPGDFCLVGVRFGSDQRPKLSSALAKQGFGLRSLFAFFVTV